MIPEDALFRSPVIICVKAGGRLSYEREVFAVNLPSLSPREVADIKVINFHGFGGNGWSSFVGETLRTDRRPSESCGCSVFSLFPKGISCSRIYLESS